MDETDEVFWLRQLRDLERWCNAKGYRVVCKPAAGDVVYYEKKLIVLDAKMSDEIMMYTLLHEIGHVRLFDSKKYYRIYGYIFENFSKTSLTYKCAILQEELDAWREGLKLAGMLDLYVNRRKWEVTKTKCIAGYLTWALADKTRKMKKKEQYEARAKDKD